MAVLYSMIIYIEIWGYLLMHTTAAGVILAKILYFWQKDKKWNDSERQTKDANKKDVLRVN